jgi:hypothetical protein
MWIIKNCDGTMELYFGNRKEAHRAARRWVMLHRDPVMLYKGKDLYKVYDIPEPSESHKWYVKHGMA